MGIAVGIDLGTSNSVVAVYKDGKPIPLADAEGRQGLGFVTRELGAQQAVEGSIVTPPSR